MGRFRRFPGPFGKRTGGAIPYPADTTGSLASGVGRQLRALDFLGIQDASRVPNPNHARWSPHLHRSLRKDTSVGVPRSQIMQYIGVPFVISPNISSRSVLIKLSYYYLSSSTFIPSHLPFTSTFTFWLTGWMLGPSNLMWKMYVPTGIRVAMPARACLPFEKMKASSRPSMVYTKST